MGEGLKSHSSESVGGELGLDEGIGHFGDGREGLRGDGDSCDRHLKRERKGGIDSQREQLDASEQSREGRSWTNAILVDGPRRGGSISILNREVSLFLRSSE